MKRRVAYILKRYPRYSETFVVNEILAQEALGADLEIFSLRHPDDGYFQDAISRVRAPVHYVTAVGKRAADFWSSLEDSARVLPGIWGSLESARGLDHRHVMQALAVAGACAERGIGHLHAHFATEASIVAGLAARWAGISHSFTAHAKDIFHSDVDRDALRQKLLRADRVVTVSDYNRRFLEALCPQAADRIRRIYNGLDLDLFSYCSNQDRPARILAVGRLVPKKGFSDLIDACAELARRGVEFECRVIGMGELEQPLRAQIGGLGLDSRVRLVGPLPQHEVRRELEMASLLAAPCIQAADGNQDGLPTVLLEAMALGTACVATPVTGIPEAIEDGTTGLLVPKAAPVALADAVERLLQNASLRSALARKARTRVQREFDMHDNARAIWEVQSPRHPDGANVLFEVAS